MVTERGINVTWKKCRFPALEITDWENLDNNFLPDRHYPREYYKSVIYGRWTSRFHARVTGDDWYRVVTLSSLRIVPPQRCWKLAWRAGTKGDHLHCDRIISQTYLRGILLQAAAVFMSGDLGTEFFIFTTLKLYLINSAVFRSVLETVQVH